MQKSAHAYFPLWCSNQGHFFRLLWNFISSDSLSQAGILEVNTIPKKAGKARLSSSHLCIVVLVASIHVCLWDDMHHADRIYIHKHTYIQWCKHSSWWLGLRRTTGFGIPGPMTHSDRICHGCFTQFIWFATERCLLWPPTKISQLTITCASTYFSWHYSITITGLLITVFPASHPSYGDAQATHSSWSQLSSLLECLHVHAPFSWQTLFTASSLESSCKRSDCFVLAEIFVVLLS